jgi:hypothetical protein
VNSSNSSAAFVLLCGAVACHGAASDARFPAQKPGCDVTVFPAAPPTAIENIGPVNAICDADVDNDACLRTLKDQACALGADVVWGVSPPITDVGKKRFAGRAAHTRRTGS